MKERMKRIIAVMLIGILILVQYTFQAPVTASQPETEQGVTISGETGTESGETKEETKTIVEEISTDTESIVSEGGETDTSREEQIEETTEVVTSEENSEEEYITSEENFGEGTTEVFTSEEVTTEEKTTEGTGIGRAITRTVGGTNTNVPITTDPTQIDPNKYVPYNRLRILAPEEIVDQTKVEISVIKNETTSIEAYGGSEHLTTVEYKEEKNEDGSVKKNSDGSIVNNKSFDAVYHGWWGEASTLIYKSFEGEYDAVAVQFVGSNSNDSSYEESYEWYSLRGWNIDYFDIQKTTMQIKVKYKGSVTYDGKPVICIATLKVTPFKNRTRGYDGNSDSYGDSLYKKNASYYPTLQISELLYNGWVWQNVKDCQAKLEFYYESGNADDEKTADVDEELGAQIQLEQTTYHDYVGSYYTINSLNPEGEGQNDDNGSYPHLYGPEYLLPQGNNNIYIVDSLTVDGKVLKSNIQKSYDGGGIVGDKGDFFLSDWTNTGTNWLDSGGKQYAYNGGSNTWLYDDSDSDGWELNSVTVMPAVTQDSFTFSMGQLLRRKNPSSVYHTANMWASITTDSFGVMRELIDITVKKEWLNSNGEDDAESHASDSVSVTLYKRYTDDNGTTKEEKIATQTISKATGWECTFKSLVPEGCLYRTIDGVSKAENAEYVVKEETFSGYEYTVEKEKSDGSITVNDDGAPYEVVDLKFTVTNKPITGKIIVSKLGVNDSPLENVIYKLQKTNENWVPYADINIENQTTALNSEGKAICTFDNLEKGNYLLTEIETVSGYNLLAEPIKITVPYTTNDTTNVDKNIYSGYQQNGDTHCYYHITYTVKNSQYLALPESGGGLRMILQICGVVLIGTSIISYFVYRKKEKGKGDD